MSSLLIAFPDNQSESGKEYRTCFKYAYYNFLECIEEGEALGFDFSEDKKNLKNIFDKVMNYDNINI